MSHFSVAVFTDGKRSVKELLNPYNENIEVAPYIELTKQQLIDNALERKKDYTQRRDRGEDITDWMQEYIDANTDEELYRCEYDEDCTYDESGNQLLTYNPNSKWDWWSVGGRFNGALKATNGEHGEGGLFIPNPQKAGKYDIAKVEDIDFSPDQKTYEQAIRWWEVVVEGSPLKENEDSKNFLSLYKPAYYLRRYKDKETYATCKSVFSTFAVVLPNGKWYERGKMGWWACVSNEDDEWDLKYKERFIDTANPEWVLTIVDCHI